MDERKVIERMIREGKLDEQEGLKLLEAFEAADARDTVLRDWQFAKDWLHRELQRSDRSKD